MTVSSGKSGDYKAFLGSAGLREGMKACGRPSDVDLMPDGSLLVSDDGNDWIYRIVYAGK